MTVYLFFEISDDEQLKFLKLFYSHERAFEYHKENPTYILIIGEQC